MPVKHLSQAAGILFDERRKFHLPDKYTKELWKDVAPFTTALSNLSYDTVNDPDFKMFEHRAGFVEQTLTVAAGGGSTWSDTDGAPGATSTVEIGALAGLDEMVSAHLVGMVFEIWNGDDYGGVVRVHAVSGSNVTVVAQGNPIEGSNECDPIANNAVLENIGNAIGEGEVSPEAFADELEIVYNSCQIMRTPVEITGTLHEAALRGYSKELSRLRVQKSFEHKIQKERTFLLGVRVGGTGMGVGDSFSVIQNNANGNKIRQTMGAITAVQKYGQTSGDKQSIFDFSGTTDPYGDVVAASEKLSQYVPSVGRFMAFASRQWLSWLSTEFLSGVANNGITIYNNEKSRFGYKITVLVTPHCEIEVAAAPILRRRHANKMLIINPDAAGLKKYRPMKYQTNIKTENGYDGIKDEYFSDEGVRLQMIETHHLWTL